MRKPIVGTMTLYDVCKAFREAGIQTSQQVIADGIANGAYPFGRLVKTGPSGNRRFEIFRKDVYDFLESKAVSWEDVPDDQTKTGEETEGEIHT